MTTIQHKRISNGWLIAGLLVGAAGLAIGTFADLPLDQMVYDPFKVWARLLAAFGPAPVFWGLGAAGFLTLDLLKDKKTMILGWLFAFCTNIVGPVYMAGSISEELGYSWWMCWIAGLLVSILPAALFWFLMRKAERKEKIKCIWFLLIVCAGSQIGVQVLKRLWFRPRYMAMVDYAELPFRNWYEFGKTGMTQFMNIYETNHDLFRSFPSAHAASMACLFTWAAIPCFTKRGSVTLAMIVAWAGTLATMFSRLIRGAHFLSDVSAGFLITFILFCICCWCFGLTKHDDSMYEYDDDDDLDDRIGVHSAAKSTKPAKAAKSKKTAKEDGSEPVKTDSPSRTDDLFSEEDFDDTESVWVDEEATVPAGAVLEEEIETVPLSEEAADTKKEVPGNGRRSLDTDFDDTGVLVEEDAEVVSEKPLPKRSRKERTAKDLFDDSIFE